MALTFTAAGALGAASGASPYIVSTSGTSFRVGDIFVVLLAYDNSGGGGADPMSGSTISISPATGAVGASVSAQNGKNDPGTASSGLCVRCVCFPVTTAIPTATSITITWSGTVVVRAVVYGKISSSYSTAYPVFRINSGTTGTNTVAAANATAHTTALMSSGELVLCWTATENGNAITGDADTTNGSWSAIHGYAQGSGLTGMAAAMQAKIVTGLATQTFNPTGNATVTDWITGSIIFTESHPIPDAPTLNNPADASVTTDTSPVLDFTATAPDGDPLEYQVQVSLEPLIAGTIDSYTSIGSSDVFNGTKVGFSQSFTGNGIALDQVVVSLAKSGSPTGIMTCKIYAHSGTFGTSSVPTGAALATSSLSLNVTTLTGSAQNIIFPFTGADSIVLTNGTKYVVAVEGAIGNGLGDVVSVGNSSAPPHGGNWAVKTGSSWAANATFDMYFVVSYIPVIDALSATPYAGFVNPDVGGDTHPFNSGENIQYTVAIEERMLADLTPGSTNTGDYTVGARFTPTVDGEITNIRYWHQSGSTHVLKLWTIGGVEIASVTDSPGGAGAGWRQAAFSSPVPVSAGVQYVASVRIASAGYAYTTGTMPTSLGQHLTFGTDGYYVGGDAFPNTAAGGSHYHVDVIFQPTSLELTPATYYWRVRAKDVNGEVAEWSPYSSIRSFTVEDVPAVYFPVTFGMKVTV